MDDIISIEGPVESINGELILRIPLFAGGDKLAPLAKDVGYIQEEFLCIPIQTWLADKLRIMAGDLVVVSNNSGKFTIMRSSANDGKP